MEKLNEAEQTVFYLLMNQKTEKEISGILSKSQQEIEEIQKSIMYKWEVTTLIGMAVKAIKNEYWIL